MKLSIKKLRDNAIIPERATVGSAGYDLYACIEEEITIQPGKIVKIPTGISATLDCTEYALFIYARSGLASKNGITLANCVGVVDSDYRGEIIVPMINLSDIPYTILPEQRFAQMIAAPVFMPEVEVVDELSSTERGISGFGSTGK